MKNRSARYLLGKCKLNTRRLTVTHLLELLKLKTLTIPSICKGVEEPELPDAAGRNSERPLLKTVWQFLKKLNINSAISRNELSRYRKVAETKMPIAKQRKPV